MAFVYVPNGIIPSSWWPAGEGGTEFELPPTLRALCNVKRESLEVKVTRGVTTLPIAEVPNLARGDQLWIKAELPVTQTAQYLMVAAFLTGSTNPPAASWFFRCETWTRKCAQEGLTITVPQDAQQVLGIPGAEDQRRLQHFGRCCPRASGRLCARLAGPESSHARRLHASRPICRRFVPSMRLIS